MAIHYRSIKDSFINLVPLFVLFFITFNGNSVLELKYFSININYILVYYWVLRKPDTMSYGYIFVSGIITDVILGLPIGITPLALLFVAATAAYVRVVTVKVSLLADWISFVPALLVGNFIYFVGLYFSSNAVDILYMFQNSMFTFIFYPILWLPFTIISNLMKS
jgi:cell shape-determining protein MreD